MAWHITPAENVPAILREGLQPRIGDRSILVGETAPRVYLFTSYADLESADDIIDAFDENAKLAVFHVAVPRHDDGAWIELDEPVPADRVQLVVSDLDTAMDVDYKKAIYAMDQVDDPYASLEDFRKTAARVPASTLGQLVSDMQWEGLETPMHVYAGCWYIEELDDGRHLLSLGNDSKITGPDVTLADLEEHLYTYVLSEVRPAAEPGMEP